VKHPGKKCVNFITAVMVINACEMSCEIPCENMFEHQIEAVLDIMACEILCEIPVKKFNV